MLTRDKISSTLETSHEQYPHMIGAARIGAVAPTQNSYNSVFITSLHFPSLTILLCGPPGSGKTIIATRLGDREAPSLSFPSELTLQAQLEVDSRYYLITLVDLPGRQRIKDVIAKVDAFLLVFDVSSQVSFEACTEYIEEIQRAREGVLHCVLIGNKSDLAQQVDEQAMRNFCELYRIGGYMLSNRGDVEGLRDMLRSVVRLRCSSIESVANYPPNIISRSPSPTPPSTADLIEDDRESINCCCSLS